MMNVVFAALGIYSAVVGALYFLQRGLIYFPTQDLSTPAASGVAEMTPIRVTTADGLELVSWYAPARGDNPTIVYFHGNGGNIAGRGLKARPYLDVGFGMLLVEYRGYGGNPGSPSEDGLYADGRANLAYLARQGIGPGNWVLYGESLGTGPAVHLAREQAERAMPVAAVVLESPFESLAEAAATHYPLVPARTLVRDRFDSIDKIAAIAAPLLVVHGEADGVIPIEQGKRLFSKALEPKNGHWIGTGGHNDLYQHGAPEIVVEFLRRRLAGGRRVN